MSNQITPSNPRVELGKLLNLVVRGEGEKLEAKQYLVSKSFDYRELLEEVRKQGILKSEEVLVAVSELLIERGYVLKVDMAFLDLGELGRPSSAMADVYRQKLNNSVDVVAEAAKVLESCYLNFVGPEGDLHVLKTDEGHVLGHVKIFISGGRIFRNLELDIIGPAGADFPRNLSKQVEERIKEILMENFPEDNLTFRVFVIRSDLTISEDFLLGAA